jgi:GNAT superfamily N-acetyltransferase
MTICPGLVASGGRNLCGSNLTTGFAVADQALSLLYPRHSTMGSRILVREQDSGSRDRGTEGQLDCRTHLRVASEADLEETYGVFVRANDDLNRRLGRQVDIESHSLLTRAMAIRRNGLRYDPTRFWVADFDGSVGGFGLAIRRRSFWYLAALHVLPEYQSRGVGRELLRRCLGDPIDLPPSLLTISESANIVSTGLYASLGLFPQSAIIQLKGVAKSLGRGLVTLRPVNAKTNEHCFDRMDQLVLGEIRPEDHDSWSLVPNLMPYLVYEGDRMVGYIYVDRAGALGPAAVERSDLLCPAISAALEVLSTDGSPVARIRIPGTARESLAALLSAGFSFDTGINLFLTSCQFGRLTQYLFSGGDALF